MHTFVTGGTGFLGRHVVTRLRAAGYPVTFTGRNTATGQALAAETGARFLALDLAAATAVAQLREWLAGVEAVVHSAALAAPWGDYRDFYAANVEATQQLLSACRAARVRRLVHISTPSVYFEFRDRLNISEREPLPARPVNHYAATKRLAEDAVVACAAEIETVLLRPRALFGPWDTAVLPRLLRVAERGTLPLLRGGRALIDVTWIGNAVEAVWQALHVTGLPSGSVYNISNGEPLTARELFELVSQELGLSVRLRPMPYRLATALAAGAEWWAARVSHREPRVTRYSLALLAYSQTLDISAARRELGYKPAVSVAAGMRQYAAWWRAQKEHDEPA